MHALGTRGGMRACGRPRMEYYPSMRQLENRREICLSSLPRVIPFAEKETYRLVDLSFDAEDRVLRFPLSRSIALELRGVDILMADP